MTSERVYQIFRETGALLEGHFELRSGLHSDKFFQCAIICSYPHYVNELCSELAEKIKSNSSDYKDAIVVAPAMGGIIVGHELAKALSLRSYFVEKKDNKLVMRRFNITKGEKYIVAEDVVTRGGRIQETVDIIQNAGGIVSAIAVLVDRSGGRYRPNMPLYSLLEMEPVTYEPNNCPLCSEGIPLVHPGS